MVFKSPPLPFNVKIAYSRNIKSAIDLTRDEFLNARLSKIPPQDIMSLLREDPC